MAYYSDMVRQPTCVYRFYDAEGVLLYVGLTMRFKERLSAHKRRDWWHLVSRCDVEWFDGREPAKTAEREAIATEDPTYNITRPANAGIEIRDITGVDKECLGSE